MLINEVRYISSLCSLACVNKVGFKLNFYPAHLFGHLLLNKKSTSMICVTCTLRSLKSRDVTVMYVPRDMCLG